MIILIKMDHKLSPLTLFADLFVLYDVFNIIIMLEYTWSEKWRGKSIGLCP